MKPTTVTPESMQSDGQALTGVAEDMATGLTDLQNTIQGDGYPWGGDEQGTIFAGIYQVVLGKAFESIVTHVRQVGYAGQALTAQATAYDQVETGTTQAFTSMKLG